MRATEIIANFLTIKRKRHEHGAPLLTGAAYYSITISAPSAAIAANSGIPRTNDIRC